MAGEVALRLLLKGQREMATGLRDVTKQTGELGKVADQASVGAKRLSGGLNAVQKQGAAATASTRALVKATQQVADAQQAAAAASKAAADARLKAATALADATAKQAAGDLDGAKAARTHAAALQAQATAANRSAIAMRASAGAAREQVSALKASAAAADLAAGSGGGLTRMGALAKVGSPLAKTGVALGLYTGYEGAKRYGGLATQMTQLNTLAHVPQSQIPGLTKWAMNNSVGLRESAGTLSTQMYRIASSAPGKPYSPAELERLTRAAAMLSAVGGPNADPEQTARIFGIIRANGGLGVRNPSRMGAVIAAGVGTGDMTMSDAVDALGTGGLAVNAARHRLSLQQVMGVLAQEGDLGVNGSTAGMAMQHAITLLASPNRQASKIYQSLGLNPTMVDQVMRTRGLTAGIGLLKRSLDAAIPAGGTASAGQFTALGYSRKQASAMAKAGPQSLQDLYLTRMFGGAKQSVPIVALFNGLTRTNAKISGVGATSGANSLQSLYGKASTTPAEQWKRLDLDLQHLELTVGQKLVPDLISMGNWLSRNEGAVKDLGVTLGVLAIPAVSAYAAKLVMDGVGSAQKFSGALRGANTELSRTGGIAAGQSRGVGVLGSAVMGVTAAIGVWELGRATSGHGAGGALTAGLGGAVAGMTVGLAIGGPWGAAIGAAGGALVGLAAHFEGVKSQVYDANTAVSSLTTNLRGALGTDKKLFGMNEKSFIGNWLEQNPQTARTLDRYGVGVKGIERYLSTGQVGAKANGPDWSLFNEASSGHWVNTPGGGKQLVGQNNQAIDASQALAVLLMAYKNAFPAANAVADILSGHIEVHIDGKHVQTAVHAHDRHAIGRNRAN